jgi:transcriptional regulator with XRE-family HTH domain
MARTRLADATWSARMLRTEIGREIREARRASGIGLRAAAAAVEMSPTKLGRIERAELPRVSIDDLCRACSAVGLRMAARAYPNGDPVRDAPQLAVLARFRRLLPDSVAVRAEVPLPGDHDARAWDLVLRLEPDPAAVEAESRLRDIQALQRRIELKQRDGRMACVILVVNDTRANRRVLDLHRVALRTSFPLWGREVLVPIRNGATPPANGIVVL